MARRLLLKKHSEFPAGLAASIISSTTHLSFCSLSPKAQGEQQGEQQGETARLVGQGSLVGRLAARNLPL